MRVMSDYISRDAAIDAVFGAMADGRAIFPALNNLPAADVRPVVRGKWIDIRDDVYEIRCSVCGDANYIKTNYCPYCGAKMDTPDMDFRERGGDGE